MNRPFQFANRIRSFKFAFAGLWTMLKTQHNARIHACATVAIIGVGLFLGISPADWCWLILAMMAVWITEAVNTALEFLADVVSLEYHPLVKHAKDVAAAAVLISAMGAAIIGLLVLGPHLIKLIN